MSAEQLLAILERNVLAVLADDDTHIAVEVESYREAEGAGGRFIQWRVTGDKMPGGNRVGEGSTLRIALATAAGAALPEQENATFRQDIPSTTKLSEASGAAVPSEKPPEWEKALRMIADEGCDAQWARDGAPCYDMPRAEKYCQSCIAREALGDSYLNPPRVPSEQPPADRQPPEEEPVAWLTKTKDGAWLNWSEKKPSEWITSKTHMFDVMPVYRHPAPVPVSWRENPAARALRDAIDLSENGRTVQADIDALCDAIASGAVPVRPIRAGGHMKLGRTSTIAHCRVCGAEWEDLNTAFREAQEHTRRTGHTAGGQMTIVGGYSMDLYCKNDDCKGGHMTNPYQFSGRSEAACKREARKAGWRFVGKDVVCPWCVRAEQEGT